MKQATNAKSIGDKLYNLERIHSKIVFLTSKQNKIPRANLNTELTSILGELEKLIICFSGNFSNEETQEYLRSIVQTKELCRINDDNNKLRIFRSCGFMHGRCMKFKKMVMTQINSGCEICYQELCCPLLIIELERKKTRMNKYSL